MLPWRMIWTSRLRRNGIQASDLFFFLLLRNYQLRRYIVCGLNIQLMLIFKLRSPTGRIRVCWRQDSVGGDGMEGLRWHGLI